MSRSRKMDMYKDSEFKGNKWIRDTLKKRGGFDSGLHEPMKKKRFDRKNQGY